MARPENKNEYNKDDDLGGILYVIPRNIMFNSDLSHIEKLLYAMITGYVRGPRKKCFASNKHFADALGINKRRVIQILDDLEKNKLIKRSSDKDGRFISITWKI